jgi:dynein heavy chain, axonemal
VLSEIEEFQNMASNLQEASSRFRAWYNHVTSETEKLPLDWAGLDRQPFFKLLVLRCLRLDRMTIAVTNFLRNSLPNGAQYCQCDSSLNSSQVMESAY